MLVQLYKAHRLLAARIDEWRDRIEADPSGSGVRRRPIWPGQVWAITGADPSGGQDFLIFGLVDSADIDTDVRDDPLCVLSSVKTRTRTHPRKRRR